MTGSGCFDQPGAMPTLVVGMHRWYQDGVGWHLDVTSYDAMMDAHLAALAISHGATLVSCDADFGRFRHLRWEDPGAI